MFLNLFVYLSQIMKVVGRLLVQMLKSANKSLMSSTSADISKQLFKLLDQPRFVLLVQKNGFLQNKGPS